MKIAVKLKDSQGYRDFYEKDGGKKHPGRKIFSTGKIIFNEVKLKISPGNRILDIGCGAGGLIEEIRKIDDTRIIGLDIAFSQLKFAIRQGGEVIQADALKLPFHKRSFDIIIAADVLEHVPDPGNLLRETRRVLTEEGELLIGIPCDHNIFISRLWALKIAKIFSKSGHLHHFSDEREFTALLDENLYRIEKYIEDRPPAYIFGGIIEKFADSINRNDKSLLPGLAGKIREDKQFERFLKVIKDHIYIILKKIYHYYLQVTALRLITHEVYVLKVKKSS
jgi:ubiquinone/menaquinone biosynthesis C-methylase UbiE